MFKRFILVLVFSFFLSQIGEAKAVLPQKQEGKTVQVAMPQFVQQSPTAYQKFLKEARSEKGLFTVYQLGDKYYFEIPASSLNKEMLLASKISATGVVGKGHAGKMISVSKMLFFTREGDKLFLREKPQIKFDKGLSLAFARNYIAPIKEQYKIVQTSPRDSSFVIEVNNSILSNGSSSGSSIVGARAFATNINVKCHFMNGGTEPNETYETRSLMMLPEKVMRSRVFDPRMNYASIKYTCFTEHDQVGSSEYISRWDLQPKPEDLARYKAGKLVEPVRQIVFYVDNAFPEWWKPYIKKGIEDWQKAFEKIGFKNAIIAKDFPENDPDFDPEDIRYSCVRYVPDAISNALGFTWEDPRSGEIIQGSVYMFHDIIKMYHDWAFAQLAATVPAVRKRILDEDLLGRLIRETATHETGHALGLQHNMKGSSAYPVDSLRSATFTQKHGITASIMDYARFNYVAQPEDKGVSYLPPLLGEYDYFAIKVGYKPIFEAKTPEEELPTLNNWLTEHGDDAAYINGPQGGTRIADDPSAQSEDVGDDAIKAGKYAIKNIKRILDHLVEWTSEEGRNYNRTSAMYNEVMRQYDSYIVQVMAYIGGVYRYSPVAGDPKPAYCVVPKAKQREALNFLFDEMQNQPLWMIRPDISRKIGTMSMTGKIIIKQEDVLSSLMGDLLSRVERSSSLAEDSYTVDEYMQDIYKRVWASTLAAKAPNQYERALQFSYIKMLPLDKNNLSSEFKTSYYTYLLKVKALLESVKHAGDDVTRAHYQLLFKGAEKALNN